MALAAAHPTSAPLRRRTQVLSPQGEQMWQQQNTQQEVHFNIAARGPGTYKAW